MTQKTNLIKFILLLTMIGGAIYIAPHFLRATVISDTDTEAATASYDWGDRLLHIYYDLDGGVNSPSNPTCLEISNQSVILHSPYKENCIFDGWYYDSTFTKPAKFIVSDTSGTIVLHAKWDSSINNFDNVNNYPYNFSNRFLYKVDPTKICLKDLAFGFLDDLSVPGMPSTKESDVYSSIIFSTSQCPQGLCFTEDYILITSYSTEKEVMGELMVFDRETDEYLVTLAMDSKSHLGGICYDGANIWVCNSENMTIERISYDFINLMVNKNRGSVVDASEVVDSYKVKNTPSCITFHDGRIWIATHSVLFHARLVSYYYDSGKDQLSKLSTYTVPQRVQGIVFDENGHIFLSTSYGRNSSSYLKAYESVSDLTSSPDYPNYTIEMPPCSEEIDIDEEGNLYIIFESAGEKYYEGTDGGGRSAYPLDQILVIAPFFE